MNIAELFRRPEWLPILLLAPLLWGVQNLLDRRRAKRLAILLGPHVPHLAAELDGRRRRWQRLLMAVGLLLALLAALGPTPGQPVEDLEWRGIDLVVGLDISRSMLAKDAVPDRLTFAKQAIAALAKRAQGNRLALVVFAGDARLLVPLTLDAPTFAGLLDLADPTAVELGGTDLGAALETALNALAGQSENPGAVVLVTDGEDRGQRGLEMASVCKERGVIVHCVGLGTRLGSKIDLRGEGGQGFLRTRGGEEVISAMDEASLRRIAEATGGAFRQAGASRDALVGLYEDQILPKAKTAFHSGEPTHKENHYQWPLLIAFLLWMLGLGLTSKRSAMTSPRQHPSSKTLRLALAAFCLLLPLGCGRGSEQAHFVRSLAALRSGALEPSQASADELRQGGKPEDVALGAFLSGNIAFERSKRAEIALLAPVPDPRALQVTITHAEDALVAWQEAATTRRDWPAARRNVERALLRLEQLRERRSVGSKGKPRFVPGGKPKPDDTKKPDSPTPDPERTEDPSGEPETGIESRDLPAQGVLDLLGLLEKKQHEKLKMRRKERGTRKDRAERDW